MYAVYQHWDPLEVCVVGKAYPPEFYSWIKDIDTRKKFEQVALELLEVELPIGLGGVKSYQILMNSEC